MMDDKQEIVIKLENIDLEFNINLASNFVIFHNLNMIVHESEKVGIFGPSGIGKTSLLKIISGILKPSSGVVYIKNNFGLLSEEFSLNPYLTVLEYLDYLKLLNMIEEPVNVLLNKYSLNEIQTNLINDLSKGQIQILRLVSVLLKKPKIILADEPFSNLDVESIKQINKIFQDIVESEHITILMTTHNLNHFKGFDSLYEIKDSKLINLESIGKE